MRVSTSSIGLLVVAAVCGAVQGSTIVTAPFEGIRYTHRVQTVPRPLQIHLLEIDPTATGISFLITPDNGPAAGENTRRTTTQFLTQSGAQAAVNASFFFLEGGATLNRGLVASQGNAYSPFETDTRPWPVFNISAENIAQIVNRGTPRAANFAVSPAIPLYNAVSGSERIVTNGVNTAGQVTFGEPTVLHPRTVAGIKADGTIVLAAIDGRANGFSEGMRSSEVADLLIAYGVVDAVNLDGGGSTTMAFADPTPRVLNRPSDGSQRSVATHLGVFANQATETVDYFVFADFFGGDPGNFSRDPGHSGSTAGILNTSSATTLAMANAPSVGWAQQLSIIDDPSINTVSENPDGGWFVRHVSGSSASRSQNTPRPTTGYIGLWAKTETPGVDISIAIDNTNNTTADRGLRQSLIPDGNWRLYEWNLEDDRHWEGWFQGDGKIDTVDFTIDSVQLFGPNSDAIVFFDAIAHNALGSLAGNLLPGDYKRDGIVGTDDYLDWRATFGRAVPPGIGADGNENGIVDAADYVIWRKHAVPPIKAGLVQIHFSDQANGALQGQPAGGAGLIGSWGTGSANPVVGNGDLTAPAGTNFNLTQPDGGKRVEISLTGGDRQNSVELEIPLSGTIWGTFLVNNNNGGKAGIGFNTTHNQQFGTAPHLLVEGTDLVFITNTDTRTVAEGVVPTVGDSLILFKMVLDPGRTEVTIDAWINPDLLQVLPEPHVSAISTHSDVLNNDLYRIAVGGRRPSGGSTSNSLVDFVTLSDGPNAFTDVTGRPFIAPSVAASSTVTETVPEPSTAVYVWLAICAFACRFGGRSRLQYSPGTRQSAAGWLPRPLGG